jgi:hypothetical protein
MRMRKIAFGFAMAFGLGTVTLAGIGMSRGQDVADEVAAQLAGGATCPYVVSTNCTWSGGTGCSGISGFSSATSGAKGYSTTATVCGGNCGTVGLNFNAGCGYVTTVTSPAS